MAALVCCGLALWSTKTLALEPDLAEGGEIVTRLDADLDGDRKPDVAYILLRDDERELHVDLTSGANEYLTLDASPLGSGALSVKNGVLVFEDLTGGTSATASTLRYRFDHHQARMRLIGLDATYYSRTFAHDGKELSWNLLTGQEISRELQLSPAGEGDAAYDRIVEQKRARKSAPVYLRDTPDPQELVAPIG